jgi:DNA-binding Lrp family transcriptional regulator
MGAGVGAGAGETTGTAQLCAEQTVQLSPSTIARRPALHFVPSPPTAVDYSRSQLCCNAGAAVVNSRRFAGRCAACARTQEGRDGCQIAIMRLMRAVFVMLKVDPGHVNAIADVESFSEAYSITGEYDLLVKLYVDDVDGVGRLIERQIHPIAHIRETHTLLTFEAFGARKAR